MREGVGQGVRRRAKACEGVRRREKACLERALVDAAVAADAVRISTDPHVTDLAVARLVQHEELLRGLYTYSSIKLTTL